MSEYIVAVTDFGFPDLLPERAVLEPMGFKFVTGQCKTAEEVLELCRDADAILTQWAPITSEVIEGLERCRVIVRYGIGVDNVDLEAARRRNIPVANVPDYAIDEVADHTLAMLLSSVRKVPQVVSRVRRGIWEIAPCRPILGLQGRTAGLAGFGNIARAVARRLQAFGVKVIAFDPYVKEEIYASHNVGKVSWDELLEQSDFLSIHLPLTEGTRHLLNLEAFQKMKSTAHIVNTSRGGVISANDLVVALKEGLIAGAALDVLEEEPIALHHPLLALEQCLITSHCAWYSESSLSRLQDFAALEVQRTFTDGRPKHIVNGVSL